MSAAIAIAVITLCAVSGVLAVWSATSTGIALTFIAPVLLLALAQIIAYASQYFAIRPVEDELARLLETKDEQAQELEDLGEGMLSLEEESRSSASAISALTQRLAEQLEQVRRDRTGSARSAERSPPRDTAAVSGLADDRLDLYLEPIVDLRTGRTAHYRASLALRMRDGTRIGMETICDEAARAGVLPSLDLVMITRVLPVLRHLTHRNRHLAVFCSINEQSCAHSGFIDGLVKLLDENGAVARSLVLEIGQRSLTGLHLEDLAPLAQRGVGFCLADADARSADIALLARSGFRFLAFDILTLSSLPRTGSGELRSPYGEFLRNAAQHGLRVIACHIATELERDLASPFAELGYGPAFAPPRLVKRDLGTAHVPSAAA